MGFGLSIFGFQNTGGEADTNTNIANTNLTADGDRTLDMDGNELQIDAAQSFYIGQGTASLEFELNSEIISFKSDTNAPDFRIYEASGSGTNYVKLTCGALAANRTLTMPNATGTIALTSDVNSYTAGDGITLNTLEFDLDAALTTVTTITNAALKMGRDTQNLIDFATTDNEIIFRANNVNEVKVAENLFAPVTSDGAAIGSGSLMWSDLFLASASVINFNNGDVTLTHSSNALTMAGGAMTFSGGIADSGTISAGTWSGTAIGVDKGGTGQTSYTNGQILIGNTTGNTLAKSTLTAGTNVTITNAAGAITIASADTNTQYTAGDGITLNTLEFDLDAAQTIITSITNTSLLIGRDGDNNIDFTTDNQIKFRVQGADEFRMAANVLSPNASKGAALGSTTLQWSNLFLGSAAAINFNDGNCTITNNSSGQLTFSTADAAKGVIIPSRNFIPSTSTDGNVSSGDVVNFGSGTVVAGVCYYFTSAGAWANTDQRAVASSIGFLGVAMGSGTASTVGMCIRGMVTMSTDVGTIGGVVYLDRNGNFTNAPSTSSGDTNRIMGYCLDDSDGQIFFNPSQDWVTLA